MEEVKSGDELVAKAGESGLYTNAAKDRDPSCSEEIKLMRAKSLQQEVEKGAENSKSKDLVSSTLTPSLLCKVLSCPARLSHSRSSHLSLGHNIEVIEIDLGAPKREPAHVSSLVGLSLEPELEVKKETHQSFLEYLENLAHLTFFGIIGVLTRYGLGVLFNETLSVTNEATILYRDLPANMVGSFFMGWVGIVFKDHIRLFSEPLALELSTGLMGSITTYAGWNQKMIVRLTSGNVVASLAGLFLGMIAACACLLIGIDSAKALQPIIAKLHPQKIMSSQEISNKQMPVNFHREIVIPVVTAFAAACSWGIALSLLVHGRGSHDLRILWFACLVAPPGVWMRWHLACFNGRGVYGHFKWLHWEPFWQTS